MKRSIFFTSLSLLILFGLAAQSNADEITLRADDWCPYNCDPTGDKLGFMVDIAKAVFEEQGHKVDYQLMNWARAIEDVKSGAAIGLVGAGRDDAPDFNFPQVEQGMQEMCFYVKTESTWKFEGEETLKKIKFAAVKDYSYGAIIDPFIEKSPANVEFLSGDKTIEKAVKMLLADRVDAYVDDPHVLDIYLKSAGKAAAVKSAGCGVAEPVFIAFSPANPKGKEYADMLSKGTQKLRESGKFAEILKKYDVKDWK